HRAAAPRLGARRDAERSHRYGPLAHGPLGADHPAAPPAHPHDGRALMRALVPRHTEYDGLNADVADWRGTSLSRGGRAALPRRPEPVEPPSLLRRVRLRSRPTGGPRRVAASPAATAPLAPCSTGQNLYVKVLVLLLLAPFAAVTNRSDRLLN